MSQTISEREFEAFCTTRSIPFERIQETSKRTPDYELVLGSDRVVVEIKEADRNPEERESDRLLAERGYGNATGGTPGDRVRKMIRSSSTDLPAFFGPVAIGERHRSERTGFFGPKSE
jgi:hypothetical protein